MALLRGWWHPYTPRGKTRCWSLCARLCQSAILPLKFRSNNAEDDAGRLGSSPSLPAVRLPSSQRISRRVCVRQNAQDKSKAGRPIFVRDKGRWSLAPPTQVTSPRNAGRFKGLDVSDSRSQRWSVGITLDVTGGQVPPQVRMAQGLLECTCRVHHGVRCSMAKSRKSREAPQKMGRSKQEKRSSNADAAGANCTTVYKEKGSQHR